MIKLVKIVMCARSLEVVKAELEYVSNILFNILIIHILTIAVLFNIELYVYI